MPLLVYNSTMEDWVEPIRGPGLCFPNAAERTEVCARKRVGTMRGSRLTLRNQPQDYLGGLLCCAAVRLENGPSVFSDATSCGLVG